MTSLTSLLTQDTREVLPNIEYDKRYDSLCIDLRNAWMIGAITFREAEDKKDEFTNKYRRQDETN